MREISRHLLLLPQSNRLQDPQEREYINNDKYFQQIFEVPRMKFTEIPNRLQGLLSSPDPIIINHLIKYMSLTATFFH